jgi:hypothetical protein
MNDRKEMQGTVRITLPAKVAFDLSAFQKSLAVLAERLGCRACFSGVNCTFQLERDFVINERLEINSVGSPRQQLPQDPVPLRPVTATLASEVSHDLGKIQETVAKIADRLGCGACCSGFDITFRQELDFIVDEQLNIHGR